MADRYEELYARLVGRPLGVIEEAERVDRVERVRAGLALAGRTVVDGGPGPRDGADGSGDRSGASHIEGARDGARDGARGGADAEDGAGMGAAVQAARSRALRRTPVALPIGSSVPVGGPSRPDRSGT
jgi:DNA invertase Pin-like site-specific DNA recombinase